MITRVKYIAVGLFSVTVAYCLVAFVAVLFGGCFPSSSPLGVALY